MRKLYKSDQVALDSIEAYYCSCSCSGCTCNQCGCACASESLKQSTQWLEVSLNPDLEAGNRNNIMYGPSTLRS